MPWKDAGISDGSGALRWPVQLRSRAALRWLSAIIAASLLLCIAWTYNADAYLLGAAGKLKGGYTADTTWEPMAPPPASSGAPRVAWINTPSAFPGPQAITDPLLPNLPAELADAVARFLARPVLSHEEAVEWNEEECPRAQLDMQVNQDQLRGEREQWLAVTKDGVQEMRDGAVEYLEERAIEEGQDALLGPGLMETAEGSRVPVEKGSRGVVIAAGNHRTVERALVLVKELRRLGWDGGVEVWHFEGEMDNEDDRKGLEAEGVAIRMVSQEKAPGQWKNFELKAESILRSSFDEVLFLDSDNFPLADVTHLFDAPLFRDEQGGQAVFWPDLNRDHPDNAIHRVIGVPCHNAWELDSGQVLISKSGNGGLNLAALYLASYMATKGGYWFSGGDKDTFRYAFLVLGIPYTPAPRWLALLGTTLTPRAGSTADKLYCGAAMLQYGITPPRSQHVEQADRMHPEPLFVHANLLKHQAGARKGDAFRQMRRLSLSQDDVRAVVSKEMMGRMPLDFVVGGARDIPGRGLCSDIWAFGDGPSSVETVDTTETFGALMGDFEQRYFDSGVRVGGWR